MAPLPNPVRPFRCLVVGCSYSGLSGALNLIDLCNGRSPRTGHEPYKHLPDFTKIPVDITIVDERDGFFHLIGSPLAFASPTYAAKTWHKARDIPALQRPNITFVQGSLSALDTSSKTATVLAHITNLPRQIPYDFLIAATGLRRPFPVVPHSLLRKQFVLEAEKHIHDVSTAPEGVVIVGGGAVGIEMAAELKMVHPGVEVTLVHSRDKLLSSEGLPDDCKDLALELTRQAGVQVLLSHRVAQTVEVPSPSHPGRPRYEITFTNGQTLHSSKVIMAVSRPEPSTSYLPAAVLNEEGYARIKPSLFLEPAEGLHNPDFHLVAGDAAAWSGIKRAGSAMYMGQLAAVNIHQRMLQILTSERADAHVPVFKELAFVPPMIGLAIGKTAVASGPDMGTISGEDVREAYFRNDLGFTICWNHMQLGKSPAEEEEGPAEVTTS